MSGRVIDVIRRYRQYRKVDFYDTTDPTRLVTVYSNEIGKVYVINFATKDINEVKFGIDVIHRLMNDGFMPVL